MAYNLRSGGRARLLEPEAPSEQGQREQRNQVTLVLTPQEKALSNEYILKELFGYLSVEDLLECRLVNKVWNDVATGVFVPKAPIVKFWEFSHNSRMQVGPPNQFVEMMSHSRNNPCRKFFVNGDILREATGTRRTIYSDKRSHSLLVKFFEAIASSVIYLQIGTNSSPIFATVEPKDGLEYPKLKSLKLRFSSFLTSAKLDAHVDAMIGILKNSPSLECISLGFDEDVKQPAFFRIVEQVPWTQIQHLTLALFPAMRDEDFKIMDCAGSKLQLKSFHSSWFISVGYPPRLAENFRLFLERQQDTLETLKLERHRLNLGTGFGFPQLPKLKTLQIESFFQIPDELYISERFPTLSSISLCWQYWRNLGALFPTAEQPPVETVKTLEFKLDYDFDSEMHLPGRSGQLETPVRETIHRAVQLFPRVRNLTLPAKPTILKAVGVNEAWKDVEKLKLLCGNVGTADSALTGYSQEECRTLLGTRLEPVETEVDENILQFLNQVKVLELEHAGRVRGCLTDLGCRLVLLKLENVRCVDLLNHQAYNVSMSEAVVGEMQQKFQFLNKKSKK